MVHVLRTFSGSNSFYFTLTLQLQVKPRIGGGSIVILMGIKTYFYKMVVLIVKNINT